MKKEDNLFEYTFQNPFVGICVTDGKGKCLMVNDAQTRITGISKENFIGKDMRQLVDGKVISNSSTLEVLKSRKEVNLHQVTAGGKAYDVKGTPIFDDNGKIQNVISYLLDVTDIVKFKNQIHDLKVDKEKAEDQISRLLTLKKYEGKIIYYGDRMRDVVELAKKVAVSDAAVLITGPSGSGKELVADLIHENSNRKDRPFIKINCAAMPEQLLESELFGYEPGAFTGGNPKGSKGLFEAADGGSLLLDEIGEMPISLQVKMLRVLQDQEIRRIGGTRPIKVNVRIISSTNASLKSLIEMKRFREDLYFRLNVISIDVPPLNERKDDIPLLVDHLVKTFNSKYGGKKHIQMGAIQYLMSRDYPGNIRELQNTVERLIIQSPNEEISLSDTYEICNSIQIQDQEEGRFAQIELSQNKSLKAIVGEFEKQVLKEYLGIYRNTDIIARKLKMDRSTVSRKMSKYGLK